MDYKFSEVMQAFHRMCSKYDYACKVEECPISSLINDCEKAEHGRDWDGKCIEFAYKEPDEFADYVMTWAQDNPVPIYPTIGEVLRKICELMDINPRTSINTIWDERLNTEAADFFGINPINKDVLTK